MKGWALPVSLYAKLASIVGLLSIIILSLTLWTVFQTTQSLMLYQASQKASSVIKTIDSALESGIPDFEFESILLSLQSKDRDIINFNIYKLTGYLYDIASTNRRLIGSQATAEGLLAVRQNKTISRLLQNTLTVTSPLHVNGEPVYAASVAYSLSRDFRQIRSILTTILIYGLAGIFVGLLIILIFVRRYISLPVLSMAEFAGDVARGKLMPHDKRYEARRDEVGLLAGNFARMAKQLYRLLSHLRYTSDKMSTSFSRLIFHGDQTVRGVLHLADIFARMKQSVKSSDQMSFMAMETSHEVITALQLAHEHYQHQHQEVWREDTHFDPAKYYAFFTKLTMPDHRLDEVIERLEREVARIDERFAEQHDALMSISSTVKGQRDGLREVVELAQQLSLLAQGMQNSDDVT